MQAKSTFLSPPTLLPVEAIEERAKAHQRDLPDRWREWIEDGVLELLHTPVAPGLERTDRIHRAGGGECPGSGSSAFSVRNSSCFAMRRSISTTDLAR